MNVRRGCRDGRARGWSGGKKTEGGVRGYAVLVLVWPFPLTVVLHKWPQNGEKTQKSRWLPILAVMRCVRAAGDERINCFVQGWLLAVENQFLSLPICLDRWCREALMVMEGEEFHKALRCWPRARLFSPEPSRLRTIACENSVVALVGATQNTPSCPDPGPCVSFPFPRPAPLSHTGPLGSHWGVWEGPLRGRSGVPRPAVWIHGTWPKFPNFPLATNSTTRVLPSNSALLCPRSPRQSRLFFSPHRPPTIDTTSPSRLGIYCRPLIPPSLVPAPAGTWPRALSTCLPGDTGSTGWQLPELKETIATE